MPPRARRESAPEPAPPPPPFYVADVPLPVGTEMGAETIPVRAFNPGDRVPPEHVEKFGWAGYVHDPFAPEPEDGEPPADDAGEPGPAPDDPAAAQATTDEAGQPGTEEQ